MSRVQGDDAQVATYLEENITLLKMVLGKDRHTVWHLAALSGHVSVMRTLVNAVLTSSQSHERLNSSMR
jgi:saccharopine dehydrogenase-like NADP-dependent oxidoreductase